MKAIRKSESTHALAIARWEKNRAGWLEGDSFGLTSKKPRLQKLVGNGGTLWIVVSRPKPGGGRLYSVSFQLQNCNSVTYKQEGKFGKFAVLGDPNRSTLYASNDSNLLLLGLRFDPFKPIGNVHLIGKSIETPRCLTLEDVELLKSNLANVNRWSVFISYKSDDIRIARRLSESLQRIGVNTFRDRVSIPGGEIWESAILDAVEHARCLVLLVGKDTHNSIWVRKELERALEKNVFILPVLIGGNLDDWSEFGQLKRLQALRRGDENWADFVEKIARSLPTIHSAI